MISGRAAEDEAREDVEENLSISLSTYLEFALKVSLLQTYDVRAGSSNKK